MLLLQYIMYTHGSRGITSELFPTFKHFDFIIFKQIMMWFDRISRLFGNILEFLNGYITI